MFRRLILLSSIQRLVCLSAVAIFGGMAAVCCAQRVPSDACLLELDLPPGTQVTADGRDYGQRRTITFRPLRHGATYVSKLGLKLASGRTIERSLVIRGGRRVRLPLRNLEGEHPELMLQGGHTGAVTAMAFSRDGRRRNIVGL